MAIQFISVMLVSKYIFLMHPFEKQMHRILYTAVSFAVCLVACILFGEVTALFFLWLTIAIHAYLTDEKRRPQRMMLFLPISGICSGIFVPLLKLPELLLGIGETAQEIYAVIVYGAAAVCLLVFWFRGSNWRKQFREEMAYRHLEKWERNLLFFVGSLLFVLTSVLVAYTTVTLDNYELLLVLNNGIISVVCFIVTMTVIILILQGNKKARFQEELLQMQHNIIITMADIVENRDENTGGHIKRTAKYVEIIARTLQKQEKYKDILTKQYISDMIIAAPLHDMGKIHVPDAVLNKQDSLTEEEFAVMQEHTTAGRTLLRHAEKNLGHFSYLDIAVQMAGCHHEWWNGEGYPDGLRGEEIPLCARIMAVADVFDALVTKRCYKEAMSVEEAYSILRQESGTHFDPAVVNAFFSCTKQIESIQKELADNEAASVPCETAPVTE
jgi:HD-GYP domain-containing protein (c-di-GMP phosphodiesterase class II)